MEKLESKMFFKQIYVKNVKTAFEKVVNMVTANQLTIVFLDKFYEKSSNFVAVTVIFAKIRTFETIASTLCPPPPPAFILY